MYGHVTCLDLELLHETCTHTLIDQSNAEVGFVFSPQRKLRTFGVNRLSELFSHQTPATGQQYANNQDQFQRFSFQMFLAFMKTGW